VNSPSVDSSSSSSSTRSLISEGDDNFSGDEQSSVEYLGERNCYNSPSVDIDQFKNEDMLRNLSYIMQDKHGNKNLKSVGNQIKSLQESPQIKSEGVSSNEEIDVEEVELETESKDDAQS